MNKNEQPLDKTNKDLNERIPEGHNEGVLITSYHLQSTKCLKKMLET